MSRPPSPWAVHGITSLAIFAVYLDTTILFVAFPSISQTWPGVSAADLSWILNAYTIVFGALLVPAGQLADRIGRRRTFRIGVVTFVAGSVLCGAAPTVGLLVAARILQAVGAALAIPSSLALVLAAFPRSQRAVAVSLWGAVGALSAAVGPSLGALIVQHLGWRWAFYINLPVGVVALWLGMRTLVESRDDGATGRPDLVGAALLVASVGLLALAIVEGPHWGWTSLATFVTIGLGVAALLAFIVESARSSSPIVDLTLFRDRNYQLANLGMLMFSMAFSAMFLGFVLFLTRIWHYSTLHAGLTITPGPLTVLPVAILAGRYAAKRGHRNLVVIGGLLFAAGGALTMHLPTTPTFFAGWLPAAMVTGVGIGLTFPSLSGAAMHGLPPARFGVGSGVNQAIRQIGSVLGVAITIALLAANPSPRGFEHVFLLLVISGVTVSLLGLGLRTAPAAATAAK